MANYDPNYGGGAGTTGGQGNDLSSRASDAANQVKERAADMGRKAVDTVDRGLDSAADALQSTASTLRNKVPGDNRLGAMANRAANSIEGAATYMREHDVRDIVTDVEGAVRRNPGPSLLIAAAFGFLLGTAIRGGSDRSRY
jgi:ElaB/YqjD/DUF883 family membrane-anchored ribosome-binding protein